MPQNIKQKTLNSIWVTLKHSLGAITLRAQYTSISACVVVMVYTLYGTRNSNTTGLTRVVTVEMCEIIDRHFVMTLTIGLKRINPSFFCRQAFFQSRLGFWSVSIFSLVVWMCFSPTYIGCFLGFCLWHVCILARVLCHVCILARVLCHAAAGSPVVQAYRSACEARHIIVALPSCHSRATCPHGSSVGYMYQAVFDPQAQTAVRYRTGIYAEDWVTRPPGPRTHAWRP